MVSLQNLLRTWRCILPRGQVRTGRWGNAWRLLAKSNLNSVISRELSETFDAASGATPVLSWQLNIEKLPEAKNLGWVISKEQTENLEKVGFYPSSFPKPYPTLFAN